MADRSRLALAIVAVSLLAGCATKEAAPYLPTLAPLELSTGEDAGALGALLSVAATQASGEGPARIELRLRLDNDGPRAVTLAPDALEVLTADLGSLGAPEWAPATPISVPPGASATVKALFSLPAGLDVRSESLRALNVRIALEVAGARQVRAVTFARVDRERGRSFAYTYYDEWDNPIFPGRLHRHRG